MEKWGGQMPNKSFQIRDMTSINHLITKLTTGQLNESQAVAVRGLSGQLIMFHAMIQDMICSQNDAHCSHKSRREIQEYTEHCNLA